MTLPMKHETWWHFDERANEPSIRAELAGAIHRLNRDPKILDNAMLSDVRLVRQPDNPHDPNAVAVLRVDDGTQRHVGYLPRKLAFEFARAGLNPAEPALVAPRFGITMGENIPHLVLTGPAVAALQAVLAPDRAA